MLNPLSFQHGISVRSKELSQIPHELQTIVKKSAVTNILLLLIINNNALIKEEPFVLTPPPPRTVKGSILWLGSNQLEQRHFCDLWFLGLKPKYWRLLIPTSNRPFGVSHNKWFDRNSSQKEQKEMTRNSVDYIHHLINEELEKFQLQPENILLGGLGEGNNVLQWKQQ